MSVLLRRIAIATDIVIKYKPDELSSLVETKITHKINSDGYTASISLTCPDMLSTVRVDDTYNRTLNDELGAW